MNYLKKLFSSTFQKANPESLAKPSKTGDKNANKNEAVQKLQNKVNNLEPKIISSDSDDSLISSESELFHLGGLTSKVSVKKKLKKVCQKAKILSNINVLEKKKEEN